MQLEIWLDIEVLEWHYILCFIKIWPAKAYMAIPAKIIPAKTRFYSNWRFLLGSNCYCLKSFLWDYRRTLKQKWSQFSFCFKHEYQGTTIKMASEYKAQYPYPSNNSSFICFDYFEEDCFGKDLIARINFALTLVTRTLF